MCLCAGASNLLTLELGKGATKLIPQPTQLNNEYVQPTRAQPNPIPDTRLLPNIFIGPESIHWQCLSVTHWLTHSCLVDLIDVTCEDANPKLAEVVEVSDVDDVDRVADLEAEVWS